MRKKEFACLLPFVLLPILFSGCIATTQPHADRVRPTQTATAPDVTTLVGSDKATVQNQLGAPQLIRRDGPAEVWQYLADACILDLFLYEDETTHRVNYLELRTQPGAAFPRERCFEKILAAKNTQPLS